MDKEFLLVQEIVREYKNGRSLVWFIEFDGVLASDHQAPGDDAIPLAILKPIQALVELPHVLVTVVGSRTAIELRHFVPIGKLVFAGCSGSEIVADERQLGHSGVSLARRMIENIGTWIKADLSPIAGARVVVEPLSVIVGLEKLDASEANRVRVLVNGIADKFRATVRLIEGDHLIEVKSSLACNSGEVVETLLKEHPGKFPLICCVAKHSWMDDALVASQNRNGITIGLGADSKVSAQHRLAGSETFVSFLSTVVQQLASH